MDLTKPPMWSFFTISSLGLWLIAAPATFAFESAPLVISDLLSGVLLIIISLCNRKNPKASLLWFVAAIGIWLEFAPLVFWAPAAGAYINNTLVGTLVILLSVVLFPIPGQIPDTEPTIPPGWSYNPSSWPQRIPIAFFAFVCWMISRYLAAYQLGYIETVWDPFFNPGTTGVLESSVSKLFPVSDAGLGAFAYTLEFLSTCQGGKARWRTSPWGVLLFGILVIPVSLVSVILIILQPLAVGTWCTLCLVTAICMLLPIPLAVDEVIATLQYLKRARKGSRLSLLFQGGECVEAKIDKKTPSLEEPLLKICKASLWGVSFPWNLAIAALLGICLMTYPSQLHEEGILFDLDPILGALTVVATVISFSQLLRKARYLNFLFSLILIIGSLFSSEAVALHIATAIAIAIFSLRKGEASYDANHSM